MERCPVCQVVLSPFSPRPRCSRCVRLAKDDLTALCEGLITRTWQLAEVCRILACDPDEIPRALRNVRWHLRSLEKRKDELVAALSLEDPEEEASVG